MIHAYRSSRRAFVHELRSRCRNRAITGRIKLTARSHVRWAVDRWPSLWAANSRPAGRSALSAEIVTDQHFSSLRSRCCDVNHTDSVHVGRLTVAVRAKCVRGKSPRTQILHHAKVGDSARECQVIPSSCQKPPLSAENQCSGRIEIARCSPRFLRKSR